MLSEPGRQYLATLKRIPAETRRDKIVEALEEAGVPPFEPIIHFQIEYGGYATRYGLNRHIWGILHSQPDPDSFFLPDQIDHFEEDPDDDYYITCANCHCSDHWFLDSKGALYWCFDPPVASSFEKRLEREAVFWNLQRERRVDRLSFSNDTAEVFNRLLPRIEDGLIPEASDQYESLYLKKGVCASVQGERIQVFVAPDADQAILQGLQFKKGW